ncbi:MAG: hypothetical protein M1816_002129 [Peltula sp. TS41687]|nr:MAG: hypothetical protein M1816_002129 [Peltula sp. TS41687]
MPLKWGMDDIDQQRKQNAIRGYTGIPPLGPAGDNRTRPSGRPGQERSGQMPMLSNHRTSPTMPAGNASGYVYYDEGSQAASLPSLPQGTLQYQPEFSQDQQQRQQTFSQYGSGLMYGIPQQLPQSQSYDPVQPYQQRRRSTAIEVLSTQFAGVPSFYAPGEPTTATAATVPSQQAPTQFTSHQNFSQQSSSARSTLGPVYAPTMSEVQQIGATQPMTTASSEFSQGTPNYDADYGQYQTALKKTFENVRNGQLAEAAQTLLEISEWLLTHAVDLGLTRDDQSLHAERLKLWTEFNFAWLATLQRQKEATQTMLRSHPQSGTPQNMIQQEFLEKMGRDLVRLCDGMERHGLVDYEMGVWEEEIVSVLEDCLDLLERGETTEGPQGVHPTGPPGVSQDSVPIGLRTA